MLNKLRLQYPQYDDMGDMELMDAMHKTHYSDMPRDQFNMMCCCPRPNHDDLEGAAVTGGDSLDLQEMDPTVKPAVKMTVKELQKQMDRATGKVVIIWNNSAYIIDPQAIDPTEAMTDILSGNDSEVLGYPQPGPLDIAVTKQGDVVMDLPTMKRHAQTGNVAWAASGHREPLLDKAGKVSSAIMRVHSGR